MQTQTTHFLAELENLPEVEYPEEVVDRWNKEAEITLLKYATGQLIPKTAAEYAAEKGIKLA